MQAIDVSLGQQVSPLEPSQEKPADLLRSTVHMKTPFDHTISGMSCLVRALVVISPQTAERDWKERDGDCRNVEHRTPEESRQHVARPWCIRPRLQLQRRVIALDIDFRQESSA
jgi:hypothetical protein